MAGGPEDFLRAEHVVLRGSHQEIGRSLAEITRADLRVDSRPPADCHPAVIQSKKQYYRECWPEHWARMRGAAEVYGLALEDDSCDLSSLVYPSDYQLGCSNVYYPASCLTHNSSMLSRNMDFYTVRFGDGTPWASEPIRPAVFGRPLLLEVHPDTGESYLCMAVLDLLGGATDGINSAGLMVAFSGNAEAIASGLREPSPYGVGIAEEEVVRFLLERCRTADEALRLLLRTRLYFRQTPQQFVVGDASGNGFTWRYSLLRNEPEIQHANGSPLAITNHGLSEPVGFPRNVRAHPHVAGSVARLETLNRSFRNAERTARDPRWVRRNAHSVEALDAPPSRSPFIAIRTIWQSIYGASDRSLAVNFYLGDDEESGGVRRSEEYIVRLT